MIARPNSGGILMLVDLESHEKVQLYKELLDKDEQDYAETNDIPYRGDFLKQGKRAIACTLEIIPS